MPSLPVSRQRALVLAAVALALLAVAGHTLAGAGTATVQPAATLVPEQTAAPRLVVDVAGAVRRPGLYRLAEGKRVADAVARAGGATASADTSAINLAAPIADGTQVLVPRRIPGARREISCGSAQSELGLGRGARRTAGHRACHGAEDRRLPDRHGGLRSVEDLDAIPGIGPARVEQLRDLVSP